MTRPRGSSGPRDEALEKTEKRGSVGASDGPIEFGAVGVDDIEGRYGEIAVSLGEHVVVDVQNDRDEVLRQEVRNLFLW